MSRIELNRDTNDSSKVNWESVAKTYGSQSNITGVIDTIIEKLKRRSSSEIHHQINQSDLIVSNIDDLVKLSEDLKSSRGQIDKAILTANSKLSPTSYSGSSVTIQEARRDDSNALEAFFKKAEQLKKYQDNWTHVYFDTQYQTSGTERRTSSVKIESADSAASGKIDNIIKQLRDTNDKWTQVKLEVSQRVLNSSPVRIEAKRGDFESIKQLDSFINQIKVKPEQYAQINIDAILSQGQSPAKVSTSSEGLDVAKDFIHRLSKAVSSQTTYVQVPQDKVAVEIIQKFNENLKQARNESWTQVSSVEQQANVKRDKSSLVSNIINDLINVKTAVDASLSTFVPQSQEKKEKSTIQQQYFETKKRVETTEKWTQGKSVEPKAQQETKIIYKNVETPKKASTGEKWTEVNVVDSKPKTIQTKKPSKVVIKTRKPIPQPDAKANAKVKKTITYSYLDDYTPSTRIYTLGDNNDESGLKHIREIPDYFRKVNLDDEQATALYSKFTKPSAKTFDEYTTLINTGLKSSDYVQIHPLLSNTTKITKGESNINNQFAGIIKIN